MLMYMRTRPYTSLSKSNVCTDRQTDKAREVIKTSGLIYSLVMCSVPDSMIIINVIETSTYKEQLAIIVNVFPYWLGLVPITERHIAVQGFTITFG